MAEASDLDGMIQEFDTAVSEVVVTQVEPRIRDAVLDGFEQLVIRSPVFSGLYKSSHAIVLNTTDVPLPISESLAEEAKVEIGAGSVGLGVLEAPHAAIIGPAQATMANFKLGDLIVIGNAVSYAGEIEEQGTDDDPAGSFYANAAVDIRSRLDDSS